MTQCDEDLHSSRKNVVFFGRGKRSGNGSRRMSGREFIQVDVRGNPSCIDRLVVIRYTILQSDNNMATIRCVIPISDTLKPDAYLNNI